MIFADSADSDDFADSAETSNSHNFLSEVMVFQFWEPMDASSELPKFLFKGL